MSIKKFNYHKIGGVYIKDGEYLFYSHRYKQYLLIPDGYPSNGADIVEDICGKCFFIHDFICNEGRWLNGDLISNWQASFVYYDLLKEHFSLLQGQGLFPRIYNGALPYWRWIGTFLFGGGKARKNGMLWVK